MKIISVKTCNTCGIPKNIGKYSFQVFVTKSGVRKRRRRGTCKSCQIKYNVIWSRRNPRKTALYNKIRNITRYGISYNEYLELIHKQKSKCAICKIFITNKRRDTFHIDHNHKTNKVRGLLCFRCNHGLGNFQDSIKFLKSAIEYLK